jgi:hypothetical protein
VENLAYVFMSAEEGISAGWTVAIMRALLAVPGHALWGVMMGYYVGLAKFEPDKARQRALIRRGWLTAIWWHGLYDFFAFGAELSGGVFVLLMMGGLVGVVITNWVIAIRMIRKAQELSVFKRPSLMVNPVAALAIHMKFCHQCGAGASRFQRFCQRCGKEFPVVHCSACKLRNTADNRFCESCGTRLSET